MKNYRRAIVAALALSAQCGLAAPARPLVLDDYYRVQTLSDVELSPDGGEPVQLTRSTAPDHRPHFSPDGRTLAFLRDPGDGKSDPQIWVLDLRGGEARQLSHFAGRPPPITIDRLQFKADGSSFLRDERSHLYALDLESGHSSALTDGRYNELQPTWSPDGTLLAFLSKRGPDPDETNNWDVYVMPAQAGAVARQITRRPGMDGDPDNGWGTRTPQFSPDGRQLTYEAGGQPRDAWFALVQLGLANVLGDLETTPAVALDRNCLEPKFSADGRYIYFRLEDDRSLVLARFRLADSKVERLSPTGHVVNEFDVGAYGHTVVIDNMIELVLVHGGPDAQHPYEFDLARQCFVSSGYAVLAPNPRGSTGRGYAFQKKLFGRWGAADGPDVLAAVDYAVAHHVADPAQLGVGGWSYGSVLTNYVIASDRRFRAATSGAGCTYPRSW